MTTDVERWAAVTDQYDALIHTSADSVYIRREGLKKNVIELLGPPEQVAKSFVLDVGSGDGWLFKTISPLIAVELDCVEREGFLHDRPGHYFALGDACDINYPNGRFHLVVASLLLMWIEDLDVAVSELARVTKSGGRVVVALTHPFSYRTGVARDDGNYLVTHRYGNGVAEVSIADEVGPLRYYHRTVSEYLNCFTRHGLSLGECREWSIDMAHYRQHVPASSVHPARTDRVPMFLFLELQK